MGARHLALAPETAPRRGLQVRRLVTATSGRLPANVAVHTLAPLLGAAVVAAVGDVAAGTLAVAVGAATGVPVPVVGDPVATGATPTTSGGHAVRQMAPVVLAVGAPVADVPDGLGALATPRVPDVRPSLGLPTVRAALQGQTGVAEEVGPVVLGAAHVGAPVGRAVEVRTFHLGKFPHVCLLFRRLGLTLGLPTTVGVVPTQGVGHITVMAVPRSTAVTPAEMAKKCPACHWRREG